MLGDNNAERIWKARSINLKGEIKNETDTEYTCLLTFSSSDANYWK